MALSKNTVYTGTLKDIPYSAEVSPCSWMSPNYGLQVRVELKNHPAQCSWALAKNGLAIEQATPEDVEKLIQTMELIPCGTCSAMTFKPGPTGAHPKGICAHCALVEARKEMEASFAEDDKKLKKLDAKYKKAGSTHRIDAWVHPSSGDDSEIAMWMTNPTDEQIKTELKKAGCRVRTDYKVVKL